MSESLVLTGVWFSFDTLSSPLIADLSVRFPLGWTGIVGANGAGKSTLLRLVTGEYAPTQGDIQRVQPALYCPQRTDDPPDGLADLLHATDGPAYRLRGILGLEDDWLERWHTLSHGERKRAQIAVMIRKEPALLAVDEPSNHIDVETRSLLFDALRSYRGIGLLVSHDRTLLDQLCDQCLFLDPPYPVILRPGGYTKGMEQAKQDEQQARELHDKANREVKQVQRTMVDRRQRTAREHKTRSKRGLSHKDHDGRAKINAGRISDAKSGSSLRQMQGRMRQAEQRLSNIHIKKQQDLGIWLPQSRSKMDALLKVRPCEIPVGDPADPNALLLHLPELRIHPDDRIAITGRNGAGKSTLLRFMLGHLLLPKEHVMYMPQEISAEESVTILNKVRQTPPQQLGRLMNVINRLGSQPQRLLQTGQPSPGEIRKLLLALGVINAASLIVMDEPTNHLDLPSIQCLENALVECPCALVLVSHDEVLLEKLSNMWWKVVDPDSKARALEVCNKKI